MCAFPNPAPAAGSGTLNEAPAENRGKPWLLPFTPPSARSSEVSAPPGINAPAQPSVPVPDDPELSPVQRAPVTDSKKKTPKAKSGDKRPDDKNRNAGSQDGQSRKDEVPASAPARVPPNMAAEMSPKELEMQRRGIVRAEIRPSRPMLLSAPYPGTLVSVNVHDGEEVTTGQVLAVFDPRHAQRELEEARQAMTDAVERVQRMREFSVKDQEAARELLARHADKVREAEERLAMTDLSSPFAGRVMEVRASAGQHLKRGETVVELAEEGDLQIIATVPSTWVSNLSRGHIIWVWVDETAKSYEAEFVRFGGKVNSASGSIRAYARFADPPPELLPGMSGRADFFPKSSK